MKHMLILAVLAGIPAYRLPSASRPVAPHAYLADDSEECQGHNCVSGYESDQSDYGDEGVYHDPSSDHDR